MLALWSCCLAPPVLALNTTYSLAQYQHTVWTERDGAPTNISGMAIGEDGYLWAASPRGVWRFDGFDFKPVRTIGGVSLGQDAVTALFGGPHGELFLDFANGQGSAMVSAGRLVRFPACTLIPTAVQVEGATWLVCNGRFVRLVGDRLEPLGKMAGLPEGAVTALTSDRQGGLWAAVGTDLWVHPSGASGFRQLAARGLGRAIPGPDGSLWTADATGIRVTRAEGHAPGVSMPVLSDSFERLMFDRDGGLWAVGSDKLVHVGDVAALLRAPSPGLRESEVMTRKTGLGSDTVTAIFEDGRGSIWLGTTSGMERFRDNYFFPIRLPGRELAPSIAAGDDGSIWAANYTGPLMRISNASVRRFEAIDGGVTSLARDRDGTVWVAAEPGRLFRIRGDDISRAADIPPEIHGSAITDITKDVDGALWVGATINGVVGRYAQGRWTMPHGYGGLPERWASRTVLADHHGRLWASRHYDVMRLEGGIATRFSAEQGLQVGDIYALSERGDRIWVGGSTGVAYFDGSRFRTLTPAMPDAFSEVSGVLETERGDLWVHGFVAAVRVPAAELAKQRRDPAHKVNTERYDALDGLYGNSPQLAARPSMVEGTDGRLWFSTSEGVAVIDPRLPRPAPHVPPVHVQAVAVDGNELDVSGPLVLHRRTKSVRFLYTAVSPDGGERLRFRYRLEGLDSEWTDAASRRAITYNSLAPGSYRFRVQSSDDRGDWAANEATLAFTVEPLWFETLSFRLAYGLCGVLGLYALYRWQVSRTTRRVRLQMRVQQMERERIARDLHDTLLQSVQALIWRIHAIAAGVIQTDPVRGRLDDAIDRTEGLLAESRRRVMVLRQGKQVLPPLSEALRNIAANASSIHPFAHTSTIVGEEVPVDDVVQVDVCDIVREALTNAAQHGKASSVEVKVVYSRQSLVVTIIDNGVGFSPEVALSGRSGHWGIAGMRERARELGGTLTIRTGLGRGVEVTLRVRGRKAFSFAPTESWVGRMRRALRRRRDSEHSTNE